MPDQIDYVISTHGHSDHIGNNNLFLQAKHIVGFSVNFKDKYTLHPFDKGIFLLIYITIHIYLSIYCIPGGQRGNSLQ